MRFTQDPIYSRALHAFPPNLADIPTITRKNALIEASNFTSNNKRFRMKRASNPVDTLILTNNSKRFRPNVASNLVNTLILTSNSKRFRPNMASNLVDIPILTSNNKQQTNPNGQKGKDPKQ